MAIPKDSLRVLMALTRFRIVEYGGAFHLQVRSGRLSGRDEWYEANDQGDYRGFVQELGRSLKDKEGI